MITKVVAELVRKMEDENLVECSVEYIVDTGDAEKAIEYVKDRLCDGGWSIVHIDARTTWLHKLIK